MADVTTYKLSTIQQAVEIATRCPVYWFRGHRRICGSLAPKVFRGKGPHCFEESHYFSLFQSEARGIEANCPGSRDYLGWLFLMQHHGCPTRLLDWSDSILVALYFTVTEDLDADGELWCLHPGKLNSLSIGSDNIVTDEMHVRAFAKDAAMGEENNKRHVMVDQLAKLPIAIAPSLWFRRGVNQISRFTIHPRPIEGRAIEETLNYPNLVRYLIRKENKSEMTDALSALGIRPETMFPDLDGLSRGICAFADRFSRIACAPRPPRCDGQVEGRKASKSGHFR